MVDKATDWPDVLGRGDLALEQAGGGLRDGTAVRTVIGRDCQGLLGLWKM